MFFSNFMLSAKRDTEALIAHHERPWTCGVLLKDLDEPSRELIGGDFGQQEHTVFLSRRCLSNGDGITPPKQAEIS
jgi:hypothetical protein